VRDGQKVIAPIAPGSWALVNVGQVGDLEPGVRYPVESERPSVLALDGEREIPLRARDEAQVSLALDGPWIVDVDGALRAAVEEGTFLR
jgi:hypothetical protein